MSVEASHSTNASFAGSKCLRIGAEVKLFLSISNASWQDKVQFHLTSFRVNAISGRTMLENPLINRL